MKNPILFIVISLFGIGLLFSISTAEAAPHTPHHFIATALVDPVVTEFGAVTSHSKKPQENTPYIKGVELRTSIENFDDAKQDYKLRFYPRAWGETQAGRQLVKANQKAYELEQTSYLSESLKQRYKLVLEYIECSQRLNTSRTLEKVYADRVTVLRKTIATQTKADMGSLIATQDKQIALQLEIIELEGRISETTAIINRLAGREADIAFNETDLIDITSIKQIVDGLEEKGIDNNIDLERKKSQVELADGRLAVEKAKNRDYLSYLEVGSAVDSDKKWQENASVEVAIRLPFTNSSREAVWERQTALQQEKYSYNIQKTAASEKFSQLRHQIKLLSSQYDILMKERTNDSAVKTMQARITAMGGGPLELLKLNECILERDLRLNRVTYLLRSSFIDLIDLMGMFTSQPLHDYLSPNLAEL